MLFAHPSYHRKLFPNPIFNVAMAFAIFQGDDGDWAEMRSWLVWCMRNSLEDEEMNLSDVAIPHPVLKSGRATRHLSLPRGSRKLRHQKAFDEEKDGVISAQSSLESNT